MKTAIYFSGKYGSTRQYATWLHQATGYPVFDVAAPAPDHSGFERLILGTSIIVGAPTVKKWLASHWETIREKPILLFTVSGTPPGHPDLDTWLERHLPHEMRSAMDVVALRGRLDLSALPFWLRWMLRLAGKANQDPEAGRRMREGFDYMDKASLEPILQWAGIEAQTS
ncbi:flavodoxin domain-containing protein [Robiginitalea sediminis]|uniref:flavodoxin domain-containing protein n=1 Tax=Robiginitalea sediminis TaxID=1982593 RepID=UPI000B4A965D|nr:flavodoxin domain-containing protein [Robiginitalea sediminis]